MAVPASGGGGPAGYADANLLKVAQYLMSHGYSKAAAAGIAGTIAGESTGNPESQGSGGRGLIGWTPPGTLPNSAFTGNVQHDLIAQAAEIIVYNNRIGSAEVSGLNKLKDPVAAADFYSQHFEHPAVVNSDVRPDVAKWVFNNVTGGTTGTPVSGSVGPVSQDLFGGIAGDLLNPVLNVLGVSSLGDLFERAGLILFGIVLIIFGVIKLGVGGHGSSGSSGSGSGSSSGRMGSTADQGKAGSDEVDDPSLEKAYDKAEAAGELLPDEAHDTNPGKHTAPSHVKGRGSVEGVGKARQGSAAKGIEEFGKAGPALASEAPEVAEVALVA